ncbi:putative transesterase [Chaetomium sp. MPI-SDFR-AT-0129]|nr:putative transesterase [Chaetomium sp. MPI-SDFR-AT-0129]
MSTNSEPTIDTAFPAAISAGHINGAVLLATNTDNTFNYTAALGQRTLLSGEKRPQQLDDILYLASATKLLATIAALQAVEDGLLTLDDEIPSTIAPELSASNLTVLNKDATETVPAERGITLAMLLTHTSGISYDFLVPRLSKWRQENEPPLAEDARRPVEEAFRYPLGFQPGTGWMYGPGLDWAGRIVERVRGETLGEAVRKRITGPLGIAEEEVQFYPVKGEKVRERMVDLNEHDPEGLGQAVTGSPGSPNKRSQGDFGGHGGFMSGEGYIKVLRALLKNDGTLLRPETVESMFQNQIRPEAEENFQATLNGPAGGFFRLGVDAGKKLGHGYGGLLTLEDLDNWYGQHTLTWGGGLTLTWFADRKTGLAGFCAVQAALPLPIDVPAATELKQVFRRDVFRKYAASKL